MKNRCDYISRKKSISIVPFMMIQSQRNLEAHHKIRTIKLRKENAEMKSSTV